MPEGFGKILIFTGTVIMIIGVLFLFGEKIPWAGKLPGDISIQRENFRLYFPITTCIILSFVISLILFLVMRR